MVCWRSSRRYRIQQRALWLAQESSTTSHRHCATSSGCPSTVNIQARHDRLQMPSESCPVVLGRRLCLYSSRSTSSVLDWHHETVGNVQWIRTVIGSTAFAVSADVIWNSQPTQLRLTSIQTFVRKLRTFCSSSLKQRRIWGLFKLHVTNVLIIIFY